MRPDLRLSRRQLMTMALTLPWSNAVHARASGGIVSLDSGLASTLLSLGVTPVAISGLADWNRWIVEPPMPEGVADLGTTSEINLEVLVRLKPSLILSTPFLAAMKPMLEPIAPVEEFAIYVEGRKALPSSVEATCRLARLIGREQQGEDFLRQANMVFNDCQTRIGRIAASPVALISLMDERHARIYGGSGLYQGVMDRIGVTNAWQGATGYWGFQTIALEELITLPAQTRLVVLEPLMPADILHRLEGHPLWSALPFVKAKRVSVLPGVWMFGMMREAMRFSRLLTSHLKQTA